MLYSYFLEIVLTFLRGKWILSCKNFSWEGRQHSINLEMFIWLYSTVHVLHLMAMIEDS